MVPYFKALSFAVKAIFVALEESIPHPADNEDHVVSILKSSLLLLTGGFDA